MKRYKVYTIEKGLIETDNYSASRGLNWHKEDGPAYIRYYDNGNTECEIYYITDKKHRLDGPAVIEYNENGNILLQQYYINDVYYTKDDYDKELLKRKINLL